MNLIYQLIAERLEVILKPQNCKIKTLYAQLSETPQIQMGHIAFACFPLAKAFRLSPPKIALQLKQKWNVCLKSSNLVEKVEAVGPYLNFFISPKCFGEFILAPINDNSFFQYLRQQNHPEKWMIEYSQPNTHKTLHVGHMRNLCLGNALIGMARYTGQSVMAATYPGDMGTHVAKCLWYLNKFQKKPSPNEDKGNWLGKIYTDACQLLEQSKDSLQEQIHRQELTHILKEIHLREGPFYNLWKETRQWSIDLMKQAYAWADVQFDQWFWESQMDRPSLEYAQQLLKEGHLIEDQGAIGLDLSNFNLGFCMMVKSDGTGLYATKDVELAKRKFEDFKIDRNIYIVDDRQTHHFKQIFKLLEIIGFKKAKDCFHLQYDVVELPNGAMSSRKGNIIPLMELIQLMENKIKTDYLNKYLSKNKTEKEEEKEEEEEEATYWTQKQIDQTAKMVANAAIKYGMTRIDHKRKIIFNMQEWLTLDGETGPYLQYVYARINRLCNKFNYSPEDSPQWELLTNPQETALMVKLTIFNDIISKGVAKLQTAHLCGYLYKLGKLFNHFYSECPIGKAASENLKKTRLALSYATGKVMRQGLEILGIPAPKRM